MKHKKEKTYSPYGKIKRPVCIYVDNSNIYISGQLVAKKKRENTLQFRIHLINFIDLITEGHGFDEMIWGGSTPPESVEVWDHLRKNGIEPLLLPRSQSGEHDTVDQLIQLHMYRNAYRYRNKPGTIILCTGDGAGYKERKGFLYDMENFINEGWDFKLYSWDLTCHKKLKKLAKEQGKYIKLEKHYAAITFIQEEKKSRRIRK